MNLEQAFVSTVAILLGLLSVLVAVGNLDWCFRMPKARWAEERWGRRGARWGFFLLGLALILLGLYIGLFEPPRDTGASPPLLKFTQTGG